MKAEEIGKEGYIQIEGEADRNLIASILFKNGYQVSLVRNKPNGKAYRYYVKYVRTNKDIEEVLQSET